MGGFGILAGRPLRARLLVVAAVLAMASPLGSALPAQAISPTRTVSVVKATLSLSAPSVAETDLDITFSGAASPARAGGEVVLQQLSGRSWTEVGRTTQSSTGRYSLLTRVVSAGKFTFRTVASSAHPVTPITSASRVVEVHAPYILLTPSTAIAGETVEATGEIPGGSSRPIAIQRKSRDGWVTLVEATTSSTGSYAASFGAPHVASSEVRVFAPKVTVGRRIRAEFVSDAKTLTVVAQSASLSMPTTLAELETSAATVTFGPVRVGRAVALQVVRSGAWTTVATGEQSSAGTARLTFTAGAPGSYSYRAWTAAANGAPALAGPASDLEVTAAAPGPVTNVTAIPSSTSVALSWTNPSDPSLSGVMIRRAVGATPPASATAGTLVIDSAKPAIAFIDTAVTPATQYSYALFAHNVAFGFAMAGTVTTTTTVGVLPSISGTVTDAGAGHHGLANVWVTVYSPSTGGSADARTTADGSYTLSGLAAGTDYQVCFNASGATGGSSDATGYLGQCYDNQPRSSEPTPVAVTAGATRVGIDAALAVAGAISGTVTDAGGTHHGLANVLVRVSSPSDGSYEGDAKTAADGSYSVTGMPAGTDYQVCFYATGATGGSSDALGYLDQCYDNQPTTGTPTPVAVTLGRPRVGVNAGLAVAGAVSGMVSDAGGTQHGLAHVSVTAYSPSTNAYSNATTAADGSYTVSGLPVGTDYQVCFSASGATGGSSDALGYLDQCYDNQPMSGTPTPVAVTLNATRSGVNAALAGGGSISGTVSEAGGTQQGLANVWVSVSSPSNPSYVGYAMTEADGSYNVPGAPAGADYRVCFMVAGATGGSSDALGYLDQCYDNQPMSGTPTPVAVTLGAPRTGIDAAVLAGGAISGTVTDAGGSKHGLANVGVQVSSPSSGSYGGYAATAADGSYTVTGLAPGTDYTVKFNASGATGGSSDSAGYGDQFYDNQPISGTPTPVTVTARATRTAVDAALVGGGVIAGRVTDAGGTDLVLANVSVNASSASTGGSASAMTAVDGSYTLTGLAVGTDYTVCFSAEGATGGTSDATGYLGQCYDNQPISGTPTPVTVTVGVPRVGVDAALVGGGAISGRVTPASGTGLGLANVWVSVSSPSTGGNANASTAADGSYAVTGLAAGTDYQVCFYASVATGGSSDALGYIDQCYDNQPMSGTSTPVTVTVAVGATSRGISAALAAYGAISGTVTDAAGTQHGLASVSVSVSSTSTGNYGYATTVADGTYTVPRLAAGTDYTVCFSASGATGGTSDATGYVDRCYDNQPMSGTPTPVAVTLGATRAGIDAVLVGGGAISGTVSDAAGTQHGLANVSVSVSSPSTGDYRYATTAADGSYTVPSLAAGADYQVCFNASVATGGSADALGYLDRCYDNQPISGTPTPVAVTLGATRAGIDAVLVGGGAISGTVSGGWHPARTGERLGERVLPVHR